MGVRGGEGRGDGVWDEEGRGVGVRGGEGRGDGCGDGVWDEKGRRCVCVVKRGVVNV